MNWINSLTSQRVTSKISLEVFISDKIRIKEILEEEGKSKYWFMEQFSGNYQSMNRLINGQTNNIYFEILEKVCKILNRPVGDVIVRVEDE